MVSEESHQEIREYEVPVGEYLQVLWRRRWVVLFVTFLVLGIGGAHTVLWATKTYRSVTTLVPLKSTGGIGIPSLPVSSLPVLPTGLGSLISGRESDRLVNILRSRSLAQRVAVELQLASFLIKKELERAQGGSRFLFFRWDPADRVALELLSRYPDSVSGLSPAEGPTGILALPREEIERRLEGLNLPQELLNRVDAESIRTAWYRRATEVLDRVRDSIEVKVDRTDLVTVQVTAEDPRLAAQIANECISQLSWFLKTFTLTRARRNREFLEGQYRIAEERLREAERRLEEFKRRYRVVALPEQAVESFRSAVELEGQLEAKRIQRDILLSMGTSPYSAQYRQLSLEIEELSRQLEEVKNGGEGVFGVGLYQLPSLERQYAELMLEKTVREELFKYVAQEYEAAKIQETREQIGFEVLDPAQPPVEPSSPNLIRRLFLSFLAGAFLGAVAAFLVELWFRRSSFQSV